MRYEQTEHGPLPVCETEEERLWIEAVEADYNLLFRRLREAPTEAARQDIMNEYTSLDPAIQARVTGEFIRRKLAQMPTEAETRPRH